MELPSAQQLTTSASLSGIVDESQPQEPHKLVPPNVAKQSVRWKLFRLIRGRIRKLRGSR